MLYHKVFSNQGLNLIQCALWSSILYSCVERGQQHPHYQFHPQIIGTRHRIGRMLQFLHWDMLLALVVFLYSEHVLEYFFSPDLKDAQLV